MLQNMLPYKTYIVPNNIYWFELSTMKTLHGWTFRTMYVAVSHCRSMPFDSFYSFVRRKLWIGHLARRLCEGSWNGPVTIRNSCWLTVSMLNNVEAILVLYYLMSWSCMRHMQDPGLAHGPCTGNTNTCSVPQAFICINQPRYKTPVLNQCQIRSAWIIINVLKIVDVLFCLWFQHAPATCFITISLRHMAPCWRWLWQTIAQGAVRDCLWYRR